MQEMIQHLTDFSQWLWQDSVKASVMIILLWLVQTLLRRRLPAQWQYALWALLIIRLILPIDPPSPLSIFNLSREAKPVPRFVLEQQAQMTSGIPILQNPEILTEEPISPGSVQPVENEDSLDLALSDWLALSWALTLILLLGWIIWMNSRLILALKNYQIIHDAELLDLFQKCKEVIQVNQQVDLCRINQLTVPMIFGVIRPKVLMPENLLKKLTEEQLEHIFLHELAHLKRGDLWISLVITCLQALHWFNPLVWWAFRRMRADGEMACDALVLARLGQNRKISYGKTLVALLEAVRQRPAVPLAVGLADDRSLIQRRVKMIAKYTPPSRWWAAAVLAICVVVGSFALTGAKQQATISGHIEFNGIQPDSLHVGVYRDIPHDWWTIGRLFDPDQFSTQNENDFQFTVIPARYTIAAWAVGYQRAIAEIVVPDHETEIDIQFRMEPLSISDQVETVLLNGDFCGWDMSKAVPLVREGSVWKTEKLPMNQGEQYKYFVPAQNADDQFYSHDGYYSPKGSELCLIKDWGTFNNVYRGETLEFNPADYGTDGKLSTVAATGFAFQMQYEALQDSLRVFDKYYHDVRSENRGSDLQVREIAYATLTNRFEVLETGYDAYFQPIFDQFWIENLMGMHPASARVEAVYRSLNGGLTTLCTQLEACGYLDYLAELWKRIQNQEPTSILTEGGLWEGFAWFDHYLQRCPSVAEAIGMDRNALHQYVRQYIDETPHPRVRAHLLYHMGSHYAEARPPKTEWALNMINELIEEYRDDWYVTQGHAEGVLKRLKTSEGAEAPEFDVKTVNGQNFQLKEQQGKFVLIDFWAPNCGYDHPRNVKRRQLFKSISSDSLILLGVSPLGPEETISGAQESELNYFFTTEYDLLDKLYGISGFPSNVLVGPNGKIVARDILRPDMVQAIRKKMQESEVKG